MCGRFSISEGSDYEVAQRVLSDLDQRGIAVKTGDVCPGDTAAVLANNRKLIPQAFAMKWGYNLSNGKLVFNARSESAHDKPMFADGMQQRRCVIPASSYYEWEKIIGGKRKYEIKPENVTGFCLAGIYRIEQGNAVFSILTREPAPSLAFIHDRMPVIIPDNMITDWLNPRFNGHDLLRNAVLNMRYSLS